MTTNQIDNSYYLGSGSYHHVIWDWNGTLLNDAGAAWRAVKDILCQAKKAPISFSDFQRIYRHPFVEMYNMLGFGGLSPDDLSALFANWHRAYQHRLTADKIVLHEDAIEVLEHLRQQGCIQAVLSAHLHEVLIADITKFGVDHFFTRILGLAHHHGDCKRSNGAILLEELGADPGTIILIGDSSHYAEVALHLGIKCILISRGLENRERLQQHGYPVLPTLREAAKLLRAS